MLVNYSREPTKENAYHLDVGDNQDNWFLRKNYKWKQEDENYCAEFVVLNEPSLPNWMGTCHPNGSLYEKSLDLKAAQQEHIKFRAELEKHGCEVHTVREILSKDCSRNVVERVRLEDLASSCLTYELVDIDTKTDSYGNVLSISELSDREKYFISDKYKRECIEKMSVDQLVEVILTNPTICLKKSVKDTELLVTNYTYQPLVNLIFCRDQQIVTSRGLVMGRLKNYIRSREIKVMKFCFEKIGIPIIGEIEAPATLEGGDFFPAGSDLCFIGVGLRSNIHSILYMLENDLFGTDRVAVVKDYFDQSQQRMHLDTIFNIVGPKVCLLLDTIQGSTSICRRLVDEYARGPDGKYEMVQHEIEFSTYLRNNGYKIIYITEEMQEGYGCNGMNLGNGIILMVDMNTSKHMARSEEFFGKVILLDFKNIVNMFGSLHCCSQVLSRRKKAELSESTTRVGVLMCNCAANDDMDGIVELLREHRVSVSEVDYEKRTPLHIAAMFGNLRVCEFLVSYGANINSVDIWPRTPLDDALKHGHTDIAQYLTSLGGKTATQLGYNQSEIISKKVTLPKLLKLRWPELECLKPKVDTGGEQVASALKNWTLSPNRSSNSCSRLLMVSPNNFSINFGSDENYFISTSHFHMKTLVSSFSMGIRGAYQIILQEYSRFHSLLTAELGIDVYLFSHEVFENCPEAVFVADWFTTHSDAGKSKLVIYSMKFPARSNEKREYIIDFLKSKYDEIIDFTPYENGEMRVNTDFKSNTSSRIKTNTADKNNTRKSVNNNNNKNANGNCANGGKDVDYDYPNVDNNINSNNNNNNNNNDDTNNSSSSSNNNNNNNIGGHFNNTNSDCIPFESPTLVLDRMEKIAYVTECMHMDHRALKHWQELMNYEIHEFSLIRSNDPFISKLPCTRSILACFTKFNIVCFECIQLDQLEHLLRRLGNGGTKINILVTIEQAKQFAVEGTIEVTASNGDLVIICSQSAYNSFTVDQLQQMESTGSRIILVNIPLLQKLGGGSLSGMISYLY